jgi:hypothetical protein
MRLRLKASTPIVDGFHFTVESKNMFCAILQKCLIFLIADVSILKLFSRNCIAIGQELMLQEN